ncbi:MAG: hypothetical protein KN64_11825 [Sulfurovum sp. AS07-7]|nr:MAG: hypothetical protein KN64_11825 [Sulfurovum sp. AS07-7]
MKKSAFTMLELIFVIIVLGIIASIGIGRVDRDLKQEASETILSHIRLAQQLALNDDKHRVDNNSNWQRAYWRFEYGKCANTDDRYYRVGSDVDLGGGLNKSESITDPQTGKYLYTVNTCDALQKDESPTVLLGKKFGVKDIKGSGGCNNVQHIAFDELGRPHHQVASYGSSDFSKRMKTNCKLTFTMSDDSTFMIDIQANTGYATIVGQPDS